MTHRVHVKVEGHVQGVGFRFMTCREAQIRGLSGWVRNLSDGRVEAVFEGPREALESMLVWCHEGPWMASVNHVEAEWETGDPVHTGFLIRD